jgi:hypothetical protein
MKEWRRKSNGTVFVLIWKTLLVHTKNINGWKIDKACHRKGRREQKRLYKKDPTCRLGWCSTIWDTRMLLRAPPTATAVVQFHTNSFPHPPSPFLICTLPLPFLSALPLYLSYLHSPSTFLIWTPPLPFLSALPLYLSYLHSPSPFLICTPPFSFSMPILASLGEHVTINLLTS